MADSTLSYDSNQKPLASLGNSPRLSVSVSYCEQRIQFLMMIFGVFNRVFVAKILAKEEHTDRERQGVVCDVSQDNNMI